MKKTLVGRACAPQNQSERECFDGENHVRSIIRRVRLTRSIESETLIIKWQTSLWWTVIYQFADAGVYTRSIDLQTSLIEKYYSEEIFTYPNQCGTRGPFMTSCSSRQGVRKLVNYALVAKYANSFVRSSVNSWEHNQRKQGYNTPPLCRSS